MASSVLNWIADTAFEESRARSYVVAKAPRSRSSASELIVNVRRASAQFVVALLKPVPARFPGHVLNEGAPGPGGKIGGQWRPGAFR